jgi:hypothetical protein
MVSIEAVRLSRAIRSAIIERPGTAEAKQSAQRTETITPQTPAVDRVPARRVSVWPPVAEPEE